MSVQSHYDRTVTAEMLQRLPEPVQRYMAYTGVAGKPWTHTVRLRQRGRFRMAADRPWMPMTAVQSYTTDPPGFLWKARFHVAGLPFMTARDQYKAGHSRMRGRLLGLFTVFDARGEQADQGSMLRYLNEMTWFPIAYLGDNITWQGVDDHTAQVTLADGGRSVSAQMVFDDAGRVTNFIAQRYREHQGSYSLDRWETPMTEYGTLGGLNLPTRGYAVWKLPAPAGDLEYADLEITHIEYNARF